MDNGDIVRRYRTLSSEDRVTFDRWLRASAGVGIIIAGGLIAMALAGANSAAPRDARNQHNLADAVASNKDAKTSDVAHGQQPVIARAGPSDAPCLARSD